MYVKRIYIYSGIATVGKELYERQFHIKNHKKGEKKNLKMKFLNKKNKKENSTALKKANVKVEICRGNKQCAL